MFTIAALHFCYKHSGVGCDFLLTTNVQQNPMAPPASNKRSDMGATQTLRKIHGTVVAKQYPICCKCYPAPQENRFLKPVAQPPPQDKFMFLKPAAQHCMMKSFSIAMFRFCKLRLQGLVKNPLASL